MVHFENDVATMGGLAWLKCYSNTEAQLLQKYELGHYKLIESGFNCVS